MGCLAEDGYEIEIQKKAINPLEADKDDRSTANFVVSDYLRASYF
ncbi:MAG: hypothetical protein WAK60_05530 [Sedimentisphaerales bacterium]